MIQVNEIGRFAAVKSLGESAYFERHYLKTHELREELTGEISGLGVDEVIPSVANFVLFHLSPDQPTAGDVVEKCRAQNLFLRDVSLMGSAMGDRAVRVAVKDVDTNKRIVETLKDILI